MQSGELNAFTYNNPKYQINIWLKEFASGRATTNCQSLEIFAGPEIIFEKAKKDSRPILRNDIVDKYIRPTLAGKKNLPITFSHTSERYHIHSYAIGRYLLVFGYHDNHFSCSKHRVLSSSPYRNYVFDMADRRNAKLFGFYQHSLNNAGGVTIKKIDSISKLKNVPQLSLTKKKYEKSNHVDFSVVAQKPTLVAS